MKNNSPEEEIDIASFFRILKDGIKIIINSLSKFINFCIANIKPLLVFTCLGFFISIGIYWLKKPVYVADLTLTHSRLNNSECYVLINDLTELCDNDKPGNDSILSEKLNLDLGITKQIRSITCWPLNASLEKSYKDSASVLLPFKIEVKVYNASILDSLQKGILIYLESNEYASKRKKLNIEYLDKYEFRIQNEIVAIDSLKRIVDKSIIPRSMGSGVILGEPIDPVKVYEAGMNLYQTQLRIQEQRKLIDSFEVMVGFPKGATKDSNLLLNILLGLTGGYLAGLLWIVRKYKRKNNTM